jgi:hypothetical protein
MLAVMPEGEVGQERTDKSYSLVAEVLNGPKATWVRAVRFFSAL